MSEPLDPGDGLNLQEEYPPEKWPEELHKAVDERLRFWARFGWFFWPYNALLRHLEEKSHRERPQWGEDHYEGWEHSELVWRILFVQRCARAGWVERQLWLRWVFPIVVFVSLVVGMLIGHGMR